MIQLTRWQVRILFLNIFCTRNISSTEQSQVVISRPVFVGLESLESCPSLERCKFGSRESCGLGLGIEHFEVRKLQWSFRCSLRKFLWQRSGLHVWTKSLPHMLQCRLQGRNQLFISGGQFSWTSIRWRHRVYSTVVQLFRKRSQICSFRYISENENLLVLIMPVTRGAKPTLTFFAPLEKCVGHSLKICTSPSKLFAPSGVPSWLRACF